MRKIFIAIIFLIPGLIFGQQTFTKDVIIQKTTPALYLKGSGALIDFNSGDVKLTLTSNLLTLSGGNLALGANSITGTGSLGATGAGKLTKVWAIDAEFTNLPTISGASLSALYTSGNIDIGNNSLLFTGATTGNIGATGARCVKGWFTDLTVTNRPVYGSSALIAASDTASMLSKYSHLASPTFTGVATAPTIVISGGDTTTAVLGKIVYKTSDTHFYGCRSTAGAGHTQWFRLDN